MDSPDLPTTLSEREQFIADQIESARKESNAISRHQIADLLAKEHKVAFRDAFNSVDSYCDEYSPHTPEYLGKEFQVPYLKLWALLLAVLAVGTVVFTVVKYRIGDREFWYGLLVAIFLGFVASWRYLVGIFREFTKD